VAPSARFPDGNPGRKGDEERFIQLVAEILGVDEETVRRNPSLLKRLIRIVAEMLGVDEETVRRNPSLLKRLDSLDMVELVMELDDEFKWH
jgi:hypothetical protein